MENCNALASTIQQKKKCRKAQNFQGYYKTFHGIDFVWQIILKKCIDISKSIWGDEGVAFEVEKMLTIGSMMKWWW